MREKAPGSLVDARGLGGAAVAIAGGLSVLEMMILAGPHDWWRAVGVFLPPVIGWAFIVQSLAMGKAGRALGVAAAALVLHALVGVATLGSVGVISYEGIVIGGIVMVIVFIALGVVISPLVLAGAVLRPREDLDAGDAMLGWCGAWLAVLQGATFILFGDVYFHGTTPALLMVLGTMAGAGAVAVCIARGIARRRWCNQIVRGEVAGWRLRRRATIEELANLPCVFRSTEGEVAIIERVEVAGVLYRSAAIGRAVAAIRVPPTVEAHALNDA